MAKWVPQEDEDAKYFEFRKEGKTYFSKVFDQGIPGERRRFTHAVIDGTQRAVLGEIEGAICLRTTGQPRKTQFTAIIAQFGGDVRKLILQTFKEQKGGSYYGYQADSFAFLPGEFDRLLGFLNRLKFIDRSNERRFDIEDISVTSGPKIITDASDRALIHKFRHAPQADRERFLRTIQGELTPEEINLLLGRRQALEIFEAQISPNQWAEKEWQAFFEKQTWVFGYGLDYRFMRLFDREMVVGSGGTDNRNRPTVDFLMNFTDYTVLVEIKRPDTEIFQSRKGGRAGTWSFSGDFMDAISQVLEQKARWLHTSQAADHYSKDGAKLEAKTRDAKVILVIGDRAEFARSNNDRDAAIKQDTFELFRRNTRAMEILTFDELLERARFIVKE